MAIPIKITPLLKDEAARRFVKAAEATFKARGTIDYTKQIQSTREILKKAGML